MQKVLNNAQQVSDWGWERYMKGKEGGREGCRLEDSGNLGASEQGGECDDPTLPKTL